MCQSARSSVVQSIVSLTMYGPYSVNMEHWNQLSVRSTFILWLPQEWVGTRACLISTWPISSAAVCMCVCARARARVFVCGLVTDAEKKHSMSINSNLPSISSHTHRLIYSHSPSVHRLHNICRMQTLISKCLLVLIKGYLCQNKFELVSAVEFCRSSL